MIDRYFRRPILYDYLLSSIICGILYYLYLKDHIALPNADNIVSTTTDLSTIALTIAGFILTLLTVLITFKTAAKIPSNSNNEDVPLFDLFFATNLYFQTTDLLKSCIKSLIFVAVIGFSLKLLLREPYLKLLFFSNVLGLIIIVTTLLRSLLILTKIINLQKEN